MKEILAGLVHMHSFDPPIAHGDLKLASCLKSHARQSSNLRQANLLLSFDGIIKLCDFGQARFRNDQRGLASDASTTFESTHRFMSPELFVASPKVRPTNLSDVWAYGCVALQQADALSHYQKRTYGTQRNNERSKSKFKARKAACPTMPTASRLLDELNRLIDSNLIDISSFTPDRMSLDFDGTMPSWPDNIVDFGDQGLSPNRKILCRGNRAELWVHQETSVTTQVVTTYVVKAPIPPTRLRPRKTKLDPFQYLLRRIVRERYSLQHQNIVEMIGIDTSFGIYAGLVFEFCENLSLRSAVQMLEGLHYLHTFPTPIAHGDLNPSNIMVDGRGTLKLSTFSLSQIITSIPQAESSQPSADRIEVIRYLSPEMLSDSAMPSIRSDIWAYGCILFWLFSSLEPYHETKREYDVERLIQRGVLPNDAQVLREETEVDGRFRQNRQREWLFNGISDRAENCWSPSGWPTANDLLIFVRELSSEMDELEDTSTWMSRVSNLSGSIIRPPILWVQGGSTSGSWRYPKASRLNPDPRTTKISMSWTKASFKRGFFRSRTEVIIKFSMSGQSSTGSSHQIASRSAVKHEIAILMQLQHSNVCSLWGYEEDTFGSPSSPAIVTEFCPNGTLGETSVVVDKDGTAKIRNFEFAFQYAHNKSPGVMATVIRAPALAPMPSRWHPPEMFLETLGSDGSLMTRYNDLWAVGCLLAAICSSLEPYSGTDIPAVFSRIANKDKPYSRGDCSHRGVWNIAERLWGASIIDRISASDALREIAQYIN
ncbi:Protein tyrosine kinase, partial [Rhizoctonia solani]